MQGTPSEWSVDGGQTGMVSEEKIRLAVEILVREARPERVILFGSYARGEAGPDSDLDLLVVEQEVPRRQAEMARLRRALSPLRISAVILVADVHQLSSSLSVFSCFYLYD